MEATAQDAAAGAPAAAAYARGELVWGHCRGFPWWPCQIRSARALLKPEPGKEPMVRVRFLHTLDNAELGISKVLPYAPHAAELGVVPKKTFKSAGLRKKSCSALGQICRPGRRPGLSPQTGAPE